MKLAELIAAGAVGVVAAALLAPRQASAQCSVKFTSPTPRTNDFTGYSVSQAGDRYAVGIPYSNHEGRVLVFERIDGQYEMTADLLSPESPDQDGFCRDVAIAGDYLAVGAPLTDQAGADAAGAVHVYRRIAPFGSPLWVLDETITNPWPNDGDAFGAVVAMRIIGGVPVLVVGSPWSEVDAVEDAGRIWVFSRNGSGQWVIDMILQAAVLSAGQNFGSKVDLDDNRLIAAATGETVGGMNNAGAVYVFNRSGTSWIGGQRILAPLLDRSALDFFGSDVAVSGDRIAVGALGEDADGPSASGTVYIFDHNGFGWTLGERLRATDPQEFDFLGNAVDLVGDVVVSGVQRRNRVLTWRYDGIGSWVRTDVLLPVPLADPDANFGWSVALASDASSVLIGAYADVTDGLSNAGSAYLMDVVCCPVDWDRNGTVNSTDVSAFINDWFADISRGTTLTDFNRDGVVNSTDVSDFINAWFVGCDAP
jgi:hypothetical protein